ncbi:CD177 antigen-like [Pan troglodytes]|uniref:CD177 antigen-like n=1 Tax=Pan troglodytes TaxID=9598 RepID=UPI0023F21E67|nr:CD177 antigen-like [Pan troglodytes]
MITFPSPGSGGTDMVGSWLTQILGFLSPDFLTCHRGITFMTHTNLAQEPTDWTTSNTEMCEAGQVCQETLLLVDVGLTSTLESTKSCSAVGAQNSQKTTIHSAPPGVLVASYTHFCSSDLCNSASSSSVRLNSLPPQAAPVPGDRQCPTCVQPLGTCSSGSPRMTCPRGATHCYDGYIHLSGGGLITRMSIQGYVAQPSSSLLNHTRQIGIFSVCEKGDEPPPAPQPEGVEAILHRFQSHRKGPVHGSTEQGPGKANWNPQCVCIRDHLKWALRQLPSTSAGCQLTVRTHP